MPKQDKERNEGGSRPATKRTRKGSSQTDDEDDFHFEQAHRHRGEINYITSISSRTRRLQVPPQQP